MKRCSECEITKDEADFSKDRSRTDGLMIRCRDCCRRRLREYSTTRGGLGRLERAAQTFFPDWMDNGACRDESSDIFFRPVDEEGRAVKNWSSASAKAICAGCPVESECLEWILTQPGNWTEYGIWAGTDGNGRRRIRVQRALNRGRADTLARNHRTTPRGAA